MYIILHIVPCDYKGKKNPPIDCKVVHYTRWHIIIHIWSTTFIQWLHQLVPGTHLVWWSSTCSEIRQHYQYQHQHYHAMPTLQTPILRRQCSSNGCSCSVMARTHCYGWNRTPFFTESSNNWALSFPFEAWDDFGANLGVSPLRRCPLVGLIGW